MPYFYETNEFEQVAVNLFYGWGYNFYRMENQLRTDDLLVRSKVSELLAAARTDVVNTGIKYRHEHLPPPTRENPFPNPDAVRTAKAIDEEAAALTAIAAQIRSAPAPENDRMWQRHRDEAHTLLQLGQVDKELVVIAAALRGQTQSGGSPWILEHLSEIRSATDNLRAILRKRADLLTI
jgi:hypothetical protein